MKVASENGFVIAHKRKRFLGEGSVSDYLNLLHRIEREYSSNYIVVDPSVAPSRLLQHSVACISSPISTTAIIASTLNLPTIFYDSTKRISAEEPVLRGLPVLNCTNELEEWMRAIVLPSTLEKGTHG